MSLTQAEVSLMFNQVHHDRDCERLKKQNNDLQEIIKLTQEALEAKQVMRRLK